MLLIPSLDVEFIGMVAGWDIIGIWWVVGFCELASEILFWGIVIDVTIIGVICGTVKFALWIGADVATVSFRVSDKLSS